MPKDVRHQFITLFSNHKVTTFHIFDLLRLLFSYSFFKDIFPIVSREDSESYRIIKLGEKTSNVDLERMGNFTDFYYSREFRFQKRKDVIKVMALATTNIYCKKLKNKNVTRRYKLIKKYVKLDSIALIIYEGFLGKLNKCFRDNIDLIWDQFLSLHQENDNLIKDDILKSIGTEA